MAYTAYKTVKAGTEAFGELVDRKSRFIAQLVHVQNEAEAEAHIAQVRARHHDARHNVPAWILSSGAERCSDDGEPQRTSGLPTLEVLRGAGLADVCCVVTRYFGGTLLGPGGLVRAYTQATQAAVSQAAEQRNIVEMCLMVLVVVQLPYTLYERVSRMAEVYAGKIKDSLFAEDVQLTIGFREGDETDFCKALDELASGERLWKVGMPHFGEL